MAGLLPASCQPSLFSIKHTRHVQGMRHCTMCPLQNNASSGPSHATGPPKTCDVATLVTHYMQSAFQSSMEPLSVRFMSPPGSLVDNFSVGFIMGFSRALAALILLEICTGLEESEKLEMGSVIDSMRFIWCTFDAGANVIDTIEKSIMVKMRASDRQRPDVLQLSHAFTLAAEMQQASGVPGTREELLARAMTDYNKKQDVASCRLEGDERAAVKFVTIVAPNLAPLLRECWNAYKVRESAVTANFLAAPWLAQMPASALACLAAEVS